MSNLTQQTTNNQQNNEVKEEEVVENRDTIEDIFKSLKQLTISFEEFFKFYRKEITDKKEDIATLLPSNTHRATRKSLGSTNSENWEESLSPEQRVATAAAAFGEDLAVKGNSFKTIMEDFDNNYVNNIIYGDKKLNMRDLNFHSAAGEVTGARAMAIFMSKLSIGEIIHVPLWHSGFWVAIKPPTLTELIQLQIMLVDNEIELGRDTNTLIYSNYQVVFTRILTDFVVKHIAEYSIKLSPDDDIRDYISVNDYFPLVLALTAAIHPKGVSVYRTCVNTSVLDENEKPKCDFMVSAICDPKKLLWVDKSIFKNKYIKSHMSGRGSNTVSKDAVREYVNQLGIMLEKDIKIQADNGKEVIIKLNVPSLKKYIVDGEKWISNIINSTTDVYTENDTKESKFRKLYQMLYQSIMGVYNSYVKEIRIEEENGEVTKTTGSGDIDEILSILSLDESLYTSFIKEMSRYVNETTIAIVGTPIYKCPSCSKVQDNTIPGKFDQFIPINVPQYFFDQCASRAILKTQQKAQLIL